MPRYLVLALLALTVSLGLRCARNTERAELDEPITPPGAVEREPYFVWMTDSSAVIRWRTWQPAESGIRFWSDEGDTTELLLEQEGRTHTFQMLQLQPATAYHYEIRVSEDANDRYGAFRTGTHDDLVTALGLAVQTDQPKPLRPTLVRIALPNLPGV